MPLPSPIPKAFLTLQQPDPDVTLVPGLEDPGISANRLTEYRFELLDSDERFLGLLDSVEASGSIAWSAAASIKSGGELNIRDLHVIPGYPTLTEFETLQSNFATNPNLEATLLGWNSNDPTSFLASLTGTTPISGSQSALVTPAGLPAMENTNLSTNPNLEAGSLADWYQVSASYALTLDAVAEIAGSYSAVTTRSSGSVGSPTLVQQGSGVSVAGSTTVSASLPVVASAGNFLWCAVAMDKSSGAVTPPSGFTTLFVHDEPHISVWVGYKVAAGGEKLHTLTHVTSSPAGDTMWVGEYSATGSDPWTIVASASNLSTGTERTVTPSGTTAATSVIGRALAFFAIDSGNSGSGGTPTYTNSYTSIKGYVSSSRGDMAVATFTDVPASTTANTTQTHSPEAQQTSGMIVVFARTGGGGLNSTVADIHIGKASGTNGHLPCTAGVPITVSLDVRTELSGRRLWLQYIWYNAANSPTNGTSSMIVASTTAMKTERLVLTNTPPASQVGFRIRILTDLAAGNATAGERVWYDSLRVGGSGADFSYYDGDTSPGFTHRWTGAINQSLSERVRSSDGVVDRVNGHYNPNLESTLLTGWFANHPLRYPMINDTVSPISGFRSAVTTRGTDTPNTTASSVSWPDPVPSDISGLSLWFNADDLSGLSDGSLVSTWTSRAGSCSATQGTTLAKPTKQTKNGQRCVSFTTVGTPDWLALGGSALTLTNNIAGITMMARVKLVDTPAIGQIIGISGGTSGSQNRANIQPAAGIPRVGARRLDADTAQLVAGATSMGTSAIRVITGVLDYANSDAFIYMDGSLQASSTSFQTSGNTSATNSLNAAIGAGPAGTADWQGMDLYEILVFNKVLTTAERVQMEAYLATPTNVHFPCVAGVPITCSVDVKSDQSGRRITSFFRWYNTSNIAISDSVTQAQDPAISTVVRQAQTAIPPAGAVSCRWIIDVTRIAGGNAITGEKVWYDNFRLGGSDYFDGSTAAIPPGIYSYRWTGSPNVSTSERTTLQTVNSLVASINLTPGVPGAGFACTDGVPITFSLDVKTELAARKIEIWMEWLDPFDAVIASETPVVAVASTSAGAVNRVSKTATPPIGAATMRPQILVTRVSGLAVIGEKVWFDSLLVTEDGDIAYFDGSTFGPYRWLGGVSVSPSEKYETIVTPGEPSRYEGTNALVGDAMADIDWLNVRIKPIMIITDLETGNFREYPQGIFLPAAPVEEWVGGERSWRIELLDKTSILDTDIYTSGGRPSTYTLTSGANVVAAIVTLIHTTGESTPAIQADPDTTLAAAMTWDMGTTLLKIVNDLLAAANYFSIWTDSQGQFQLTPYIPPLSRPPIYEVDSPLSYGELSRMDPSWTLDNDIYSVPNRIVLVGQGSDEVPAWVATAINNNPSSPFSFISRGRWITFVETEVEAVSQVALQASAERRLVESLAVSRKIVAKHLYLPDIRINGLIKFVNSRAGIETWCVISNTEVVFDPLGMCTTNITEVTSD